MSLPCCQRCTGLYAGAAVATLLLLWLRPRLSKRFLAAHGACLLSMLPFGLYWIPQGPMLRATSGVLFGFGVAVFLWLPLAARRDWASHPRRFAAGAHACALLSTIALIPLLASWGGIGTAYVLAGWVCVGAASLLALVLATLLAIAWTPRP